MSEVCKKNYSQKKIAKHKFLELKLFNSKNSLNYFCYLKNTFNDLNLKPFRQLKKNNLNLVYVWFRVQP